MFYFFVRNVVIRLLLDDSYILCNGIDEDDTHGPKNTLNSSHVIETCLVHPKILPETVEIDSNCKYLCPLPQRMKQFKGLYFVPMDDIKLILTGSKGSFPFTAQKMKFSIQDLFSKCDQNSQFPADLVTFPDEILNGKLHFCVCSVSHLL